VSEQGWSGSARSVDLTILPTPDNELWDLHPTIDPADAAAAAEYLEGEARRHEAAEAKLAAEMDLFDAIPDEEWDRRAEEAAMLDAYERGCLPL
jgi:hypothetical protein